MTATEKYSEAYETAKTAWSALQVAKQEVTKAYEEHNDAEQKYGVLSDEEIQAWNNITKAKDQLYEAQEAYNSAHEAEREASREKEIADEQEYQTGKIYEEIAETYSKLEQARNRESIAQKAVEEERDLADNYGSDDDKAYKYHLTCQQETGDAEQEMCATYLTAISNLITDRDEQSGKMAEKCKALRDLAIQIWTDEKPEHDDWLTNIMREAGENAEFYEYTQKYNTLMSVVNRAEADQKRYDAVAEKALKNGCPETANRFNWIAWGASIIAEKVTNRAEEVYKQAQYHHEKALAVRNK